MTTNQAKATTGRSMPTPMACLTMEVSCAEGNASHKRRRIGLKERQKLLPRAKRLVEYLIVFECLTASYPGSLVKLLGTENSWFEGVFFSCKLVYELTCGSCSAS